MARITYVEWNGTEHVVDVAPGISLMRVAVSNGIPGIIAECGGNCACGTCRVYVDRAWRAQVGEPSDIEEATMEFREDDNPGKRLSCQITVTEDLDGLVVRMPERQW